MEDEILLPWKFQKKRDCSTIYQAMSAQNISMSSLNVINFKATCNESQKTAITRIIENTKKLLP